MTKSGSTNRSGRQGKRAAAVKKAAETKSKGRSGRNGRRRAAEKTAFMGDEVLIILLFALSALLLLSNLRLCGPIGAALRAMQMGAFGTIGFLFPFVLFLVVVFLLCNRENRYAVWKMTAACFLYIFLAAFFQFLYGGDLRYMGLSDFTELGIAESAGGGLIGGALAMVLHNLLGGVGAVLVLLAAMLVCLVYMTEKPLMRMLASFSVKTAGRAGARAKKDLREFSETAKAYHQEQLRIREEKRQELARGVDFDAIDLRGCGVDASGPQPVREAEPSGGTQEAAAVNAASVTAQTVPAGQDIQTSSGGGREAEDRASIFQGHISGVYEVHGTEMAGGIPMARAAASSRTAAPFSGQPLEVEDLGQETAASGTAPAFREERFLKTADRREEMPLALTESAADTEAARIAEKSAADVQWKMENPSAAAGGHPAQDSSVTIPVENPEAGTRTIVTASGHVIHSDAEQIQKRLYEKRAEKASSSENEEMKQEILEKKRLCRPYVFPPLSLLRRGGLQNIDSKGEIEQNAITLQQTLQSFGVSVTVTNVSVGPAVTRYELQPEQGVKLSRIVALTNDIKMRLAAADIRMEAPIPGKNAVGIEVPNRKGQIVFLGDILSSKEFREADGRLSFGVGKDIAGKVVVTDIAKMPHLLIAGATGSGKSVSINTLIMSILYKYKPEEVRLIMVDPKVVELQVYNGIPHLLIPVVTDPKKAASALNWAVAEMTDRYKKFAETGVRDLKGYNERVQTVREDPTVPEGEKPEKLPQIVIIIDELADLMMVAAQEVEDAICRIAQLARACGMHLVIATQRPSVNVITGLIKANVPSRIAFAVSSGVDSRTIIDMNGAEKLLGKGDMLFFPQGIPKPVRVQGAFVSDEEVQRVVDFLRDNSEVEYSEEIQSTVENPAVSAGAGENSGRDELFAEAGALLIEADKASIGMLQRRFRIGFNRAARIMDQLSDYGVVGPEEGTKPRRILMSMEAFQLLLSENG